MHKISLEDTQKANFGCLEEEELSQLEGLEYKHRINIFSYQPFNTFYIWNHICVLPVSTMNVTYLLTYISLIQQIIYCAPTRCGCPRLWVSLTSHPTNKDPIATVVSVGATLDLIWENWTWFSKPANPENDTSGARRNRDPAHKPGPSKGYTLSFVLFCF